VIREHAMNSEWFGAPVGIVDDAGFFARPAAERRDALARFAWVEYRGTSDVLPPHRALGEAGFVWVDTQVEFRLALARVPVTPSAESLEVVAGDDAGFRDDFEHCRSFEQERYLALGVTQDQLDRRFHGWAARLRAAEPAWSLELRHAGRTQGWFLAEPRGSSLSMTLAMAHRDATVSGLLVYERAAREFARRGARVGHAGFSVTNTAVHNIYAKLGAVFVAPVHCWIWFGPERA
jgi:hypothetical protein